MIHFVLHNRFKILLAVLTALILVVPVLLGDVIDVIGEAARAVAFVVTLCLILVGCLAVAGTREAIVTAMVLAVPSLLVEFMASFLWPNEIAILNHALRIVFLAFVIVRLIRYLFHPHRVTSDTLCASLCVYLLMALFWTNVYVIIETLQPGSYQVTIPGVNADRGTISESDRIAQMLYFSFTTITGLGFGDIVPITHGARMLAVIEALVGQSYLLVMVSRLVGLHASESLSNSNSESK